MRTRARYCVAPPRADAAAEIPLATKLARDPHAAWLARLVEAGDPRTDLLEDEAYDRVVARWARETGRAAS